MRLTKIVKANVGVLDAGIVGVVDYDGNLASVLEKGQPFDEFHHSG